MMRSIMAKHSEDFRDLFTGELRFYFKQRNRADLAARALVTFEQNLPIKKTAETLCCGVIEDPLELEGWEGNLFKWSKVHWADLRLYFSEQGIFNRLY